MDRTSRAQGERLAPLARQLLTELDPSADWIVHGDYHHHNILRHGGPYVAIDPAVFGGSRV